MIGQLTFRGLLPSSSDEAHPAGPTVVTLRDDLKWDCDDAEFSAYLEEAFPAEPMDDFPDLVVGRHLLLQAGERLGGQVRLRPRPAAT